jgi:hypothetical protein
VPANRLIIARPRPRERLLIGNAHMPQGLMLDVILVALGLGFFALSVGYAYACDRL